MTEQAYIHPDQINGQEYVLPPTLSTTENDQTEESEIHQTINPSVNEKAAEYPPEQTSVTTELEELQVVVPVMAKQAIMASALAGDEANNDLLASNLFKNVENLSKDLPEAEKDGMLRLAVTSLENAPSDNEIINAQRLELQRALELVRQKNNHIAQLKEFLLPQLETLRKQILMVDEYDSRRSELEAKADVLQGLVGHSSAFSQLPTDHPPTTDELEQSVKYTSPESSSPARGIEISKIIAQKALDGVKGFFR